MGVHCTRSMSYGCNFELRVYLAASLIPWGVPPPHLSLFGGDEHKCSTRERPWAESLVFPLRRYTYCSRVAFFIGNCERRSILASKARTMSSRWRKSVTKRNYLSHHCNALSRWLCVDTTTFLHRVIYTFNAAFRNCCKFRNSNPRAIFNLLKN